MNAFYYIALVVICITTLFPSAAAAADDVFVKDDGHYSSTSLNFAVAADGGFVKDDGTSINKFTPRHRRVMFDKKTTNGVVPNKAPLPFCTWHNFVGSSKYQSCQNIETEIKIECGDEDADDTTRMCKVTEHPWHNAEKEEENADVAAAATAACWVQGSFDPVTHITTDSATGSCHLKFVPLVNACAPVDALQTGFGMKAEIHNNRNTENHRDNDNSGMLLRFSRTRGAEYYNDNDPRETVPLHSIIPAHRKLQSTCGSSFLKYPENSSGCFPASGRFSRLGTSTYYGKTYAFDTCYQLGGTLFDEGEATYCWTKSYYYHHAKGIPGYVFDENFTGESPDISGFFQCVPNGDGWFQSSGLAIDCGTFCFDTYYTCGDPCQGQHEDAHSWVCTKD